MANSPLDPHGIEDFLATYRDNHHSTSNWGVQPISLEETRTGGSATVPYPTPNTTSSSQSITPRTPYTSSDYTSNSQYQSTMESGDGTYQYSIAPSDYTVSTLTSPAATNTWNNGTIPCEFVGYGDCPMSFHMDDMENWCQHVVQGHLQNRLPQVMMCWYCNEQFTSKSTDSKDLNRNLYDRFVHIRQHVQEGKGEHDIRVDWYLLEHLHQYNLIPEEDYQRVYHYWRDYVPFPDGIRRKVPVRDDVYPSTYTSPSRTAKQERDSQVPVDTRKEERRRRQEKHSHEKQHRDKHRSRR